MDNDTAQTSTPFATATSVGTPTSPTINGIAEAEWNMMGVMSVLEDMAPIIAISDPSTAQAPYYRIRAALTTAFQRPLDPAYDDLRDSITAKTEWLHANGFYSAFLASLQLVADLWPWITASDAPVPDVHERWMRCRKLELYVVQLKERYEGAGGMARHVGAVERLGRLFLELACYYHDFSKYSHAQTFISAAISVCDNAEKVPPGPLMLDRVREFMPLRADIHGLQAAIDTEIGDSVDAVEYAQKQLNIQLQLANREMTPKVAKAHTDLAMALMVSGRYDDAGAVLDEVDLATTTREGIVTRHGDGSMALQQKMVFARAWLAYLKNNLDEAWDLFSALSRERESTLGLNDSQGVLTGEIHYALGNISLHRSNMQESISNYHLAMRQFENTVGEMHVCTAKAAFKLAVCYLRVGECEVAGLLLERALGFYEDGGWEGEEGRVRWMMGLLEGKGEGDRDRGMESEFDGMLLCWAR